VPALPCCARPAKASLRPEAANHAGPAHASHAVARAHAHARAAHAASETRALLHAWHARARHLHLPGWAQARNAAPGPCHHARRTWQAHARPAWPWLLLLLLLLHGHALLLLWLLLHRHALLLLLLLCPGGM
jgi:hypothetical protein